VFDIYTIIFLALAIFIFIRLRSVLGQRTGRERPPYDPYSARDARAPTSDKVVTLPTRNAETMARPAEPAPDRWKGIAAEGSDIATGLDAIAAADRTFDAKHFVAGGRQAYEMIVGAFAAGDRKTLRSLLSREVFEGFEGAIAEREARGETVDHSFVGINKAEMVDAGVKGGSEQITVRFVSSLISATKNKDGAVIDGDPTHVAEVTDVWTFARELASRDPNWRLVATESVD
jgi:predicted lipid-binding transport protein (Tim44 family)